MALDLRQCESTSDLQVWAYLMPDYWRQDLQLREQELLVWGGWVAHEV